MGMPAHRTDWTVAMVNALPDDGKRYEVIDGELLVSPAPSLLHQRAVRLLYDLLKPYVEEVGGLELFFAPAAITFSNRREVQPDLFVLPVIDGKRATRFGDVGRLVLAVEVLSSSTRRHDQQKKRPLYQSENVPEYWIVDPTDWVIERWRPGDLVGERQTQSLVWWPHANRAALEIDIVAYFRAVQGDR
jgi:Uma2 family endonuclease